MNAPQWNTNDKQGSLRQWIETLNEEARRQFLEAGTHIEIFFIFGAEGLIKIVPVVGMEKDDVVGELKHTLAENNGYAFIHIAEAQAQNMDSADEADMLFVHAESRDGLSVAYCSVVVLQDGKKMLLDAVELDGAKLGGRFTGIFDALNE